jgi:hypothetical protein
MPPALMSRRSGEAQSEETTMNLTGHSIRVAGLSLAAALAFSLPASAEELKMTATLDGAQQNPPVTTDGKGTAALIYDTDTKALAWTVEYSGLSGAAAAGHIHGPAAKGANAGVAVPFEGAIESPIKGSATLTDDQAKALMDGMMYVNIHTAAHKDGEIRGQIEKAM